MHIQGHKQSDTGELGPQVYYCGDIWYTRFA